MKKLISNPDIVITGLGLMSSVGHDVKTACASIRAGLKRPKKLDNFYVRSKKGFEEWEDGLVTGHPVLDSDYDDGKTRLFSLLSSALADLHDSSEFDKSLRAKTPLYISLPENGREQCDKDEIFAFISEDSNEFFYNPEKISTYTLGHAGMIFAIADAAESIQAGEAEQAVILGVDTLISFDDLSRFNNQERLKTELNSDGFIPGESASALLIEKKSSAEKRKANIGAVLEMISTGHENDHLLSEKPATGSGLAGCVKAMLEPGEEKSLSVSAIISDLNGETYRFEEWAMIQPKVMRHITGDKQLVCPARNIGDTGSASAGVSICVAVRAMARGYLGSGKTDNSGNALILSSSDSGKRGALYLTQYKAADDDPS